MTHSQGSLPATADLPAAWLAKAPCTADPEAMFPNNNNAASIDNAKSFCRRCSAVNSCLQWALETGEENGVWGGLSEAERRQLRRRPVRTISIDDYAGTRPTRTSRAGRTLEQLWQDGADPDGDHVMWIGPKTVHHSEGTVTPNRLAFYLDRKRWPEGEVRRSCAVYGCVRPSHLSDRLERAGIAA